jgi:hypothetical protein
MCRPETAGCPVDIVVEPVVFRFAIIRKEEDHLTTERCGDLVLILKHMLPITPPLVSANLLSAFHHGFTTDAVLLPPEKRENLIGDPPRESSRGGDQTAQKADPKTL